MSKIFSFLYESIPYLMGFAIVIGTVGAAVGFSIGQFLIASVLMVICIFTGYLYRLL